jgi:hypothetical protein
MLQGYHHISTLFKEAQKNEHKVEKNTAPFLTPTLFSHLHRST